MYEEAILRISEACRLNSPANENDYTDENGIIYCGICHSPRQLDVTLCGKPMRVFCACKCVSQAAERLKAEKNAAGAQEKAESFRRQGFTDIAYLGMTFDKDENPEHTLSKASRHYAECFSPTPQQHGIMFMGNVGTGKTFYACCIANAVIDRGFSVWVTTLQPLVRALTDRVSANETIERIQSVDLLVLDDMGTTAQNDFTTDKLFEIVDARYRCGKPLIVTTNIHPGDMENCSLGMRRIFDRLKERCRSVVVDGKSRRRGE